MTVSSDVGTTRRPPDPVLNDRASSTPKSGFPAAASTAASTNRAGIGSAAWARSKAAISWSRRPASATSSVSQPAIDGSGRRAATTATLRAGRRRTAKANAPRDTSSAQCTSSITTTIGAVVARWRHVPSSPRPTARTSKPVTGAALRRRADSSATRGSGSRKPRSSTSAQRSISAPPGRFVSSSLGRVRSTCQGTPSSAARTRALLPNPASPTMVVAEDDSGAERMRPASSASSWPRPIKRTADTLRGWRRSGRVRATGADPHRLNGGIGAGVGFAAGGRAARSTDDQAPRRRLISAVIAGTTLCRSPMTA